MNTSVEIVFFRKNRGRYGIGRENRIRFQGFTRRCKTAQYNMVCDFCAFFGGKRKGAG